MRNLLRLLATLRSLSEQIAGRKVAIHIVGTIVIMDSDSGPRQRGADAGD
jgi:hypothetical protein